MKQIDPEQALNEWFATVEPRHSPPEILEKVFTVTRRSGQRHGWFGRLEAVFKPDIPLTRRQEMNRMIISVGGIAAAVVLVVAAVGALAGDRLPGVGGPATPAPAASPSPAPITGSLPAEHTAVIARHAAALNSRDAEAFVDVFAANGVFDPRGGFAASSSLFANTLPIADRSLVEPFMAISDAWRFEAEVVTCDELSKSEYDRRYARYGDGDLYGHCAVKSRWPTLSLEIGEWWYYEFNGTDILYWGQAVRDATPVARTLPLGLDGLLEWEAWLESTDPDAAARLLNPRVYPVTVPCRAGTTFVDETHTTTAPPEPPCEWSSEDVDMERITSNGYGRGEAGWVIAGKRFSPSALIPYDPAMSDEIEASVQQYLDRR